MFCTTYISAVHSSQLVKKGTEKNQQNLTTQTKTMNEVKGKKCSFTISTIVDEILTRLESFLWECLCCHLIILLHTKKVQIT